ncbi:MAG: 5-(carboxyamino)imidazole ribonucleotide synthase [Gammaproteobacteria bacterium]|nr:5-(carboxyamino)imidazole ribonucleotide synthase [Gammaproteobacteria bacterium]
MMALAGFPLGIRCAFYDGDLTAPAAPLGANFGKSQLDEFLKSVDVVTYESENISADLADYVAERKPIFPGPDSLRISQNRLREKSLCNELGIPTPEFRAINSLDDLENAALELGLPAVLKTTTMGYDGKGQAVLRSPADLESAWNALGAQAPLILEAFVPFVRELSLLAVRNAAGECAFYPLTENWHYEGILRYSIAPAENVDDALQACAEVYMHKLLDHLRHVGMLTLELFQTADGQLLANEMAPRVHNSGHWTIEGAETSQFENHLRAICGKPLGSTEAREPSAMVNIIGQYGALDDVLKQPGAHLHTYDKEERPARKIGHINLHCHNHPELHDKIRALKDWLPDEAPILKG